MEDYVEIILLIGIIASGFAWVQTNALKGTEAKLQDANRRTEQALKDLHKAQDERAETQNELKQQLLIIEKKEKLFKIWQNGLSERAPKIGQLISDYKTLYMDLSAKLLETKKRPALKEASRIREVRKDYKVTLKENKLLKYQIELLLELYPDLEMYLDDFTSLEQLSNLHSIDDLSDSHDRVRDYLSQDDYNNLSTRVRNQRALDNYVSSYKKSNWQIGRDYEMAIAHHYTTEGWDVEYTGIQEGLGDLGRDLICKKAGETKIIQCKYWAAHKEIHEKHIFQLYGTTVLYNLHIEDLLTQPAKAVFVTNIELSHNAKSFAAELGIEIREKCALNDFPRIKCNFGRDINNKETKIYHLPMDQNYDRTQIKDNKCFFAWTVEEAEDEGFRRSYRWSGTPPL